MKAGIKASSAVRTHLTGKIRPFVMISASSSTFGFT